MSRSADDRSDRDRSDQDRSDQDRAAQEGVEHLQAAAHEMLAAARSFLDVVEDVVKDREKLQGVAGVVTDLLGSAGSTLARAAERVTGDGDGGRSGDDSAGPRPRVRRIDVDG